MAQENPFLIQDKDGTILRITLDEADPTRAAVDSFRRDDASWGGVTEALQEAAAARDLRELSGDLARDLNLGFVVEY